MARVLLALVLLLQTAPPIEDPDVVLYQSPMEATVVDGFRPPAHIGAPGNRGLEYGQSANQAVRAAAAGHVMFAGQVGVRKVVTVQHADGVRTTYTGLLDVWVTTRDYVLAGQTIAVALDGFHLGARLGDHYLDPQVLLDASQTITRARLLPPPPD